MNINNIKENYNRYLQYQYLSQHGGSTGNVVSDLSKIVNDIAEGVDKIPKPTPKFGTSFDDLVDNIVGVVVGTLQTTVDGLNTMVEMIELPFDIGKAATAPGAPLPSNIGDHI